MVATRAIIRLHETLRRKNASMTLPATLLEPSGVLPWAERFHTSAGAHVTTEAATVAARQRAEALFHTDPG